MVKISVISTHPSFAGLDMRQVRVTLGTLDEPSLFFGFKRQPVHLSNLGEAGQNPRLLEISKRHPLIFESNVDFYALGNVATDPFQASRALTVIVDMVRRGLLKVEKDGAVLTADQVANFTP